MLVESVGGGGGDGGGAAGVFSLGGDGAGGGDGGIARGFLSGTIRTGVDGSGDGAIGVLIQSVGGGGGNGGFAGGIALPVSVAIGGKGAEGGNGGDVFVRNADVPGLVVSTGGVSATGILAQSVGGGGGDGGGAFSAGLVSVSVGASAGKGGNGQLVDYDVRNADVTTFGPLSTGILIQSVGGGGGNGGSAVAASIGVSVAVGGSGAAGGNGGTVKATSYANINTHGAQSSGLVVQSVGGGGGNGGTAGAISAGIGNASVAVGGKGDKGGNGGPVDVTHVGDITVRGENSKAILVQSIGGGGGNGGDAWSGAFSASPFPSGSLSISIGGEGAGGGNGEAVKLTASGNLKSLSSGGGTGGIVAQSIGGGGGNGGSAAALSGTLSPTVSVSATLGVGGKGGKGGTGGTVEVTTTSGSIVVNGVNAAGILAQSIGGGGGNGGDSWGASGGYAGAVSVNATVNVGGKGGEGSTSSKVTVKNAMDITTTGAGVNGEGQRNMSAAIRAQSIGGGGGNGGSANGATASLLGSGNITVDANVTIGGSGGTGNHGGEVDVTNSGTLRTTGQFSSGIEALSIGGGGGSGGSSNADSFRAVGASGTSISAKVALGGGGGNAGDGRTVKVDNSGDITTYGLGSHGVIAMSIGGGGGAGGASSVRDQVLDLEDLAFGGEPPQEANAANSKESSSSKTEISIGVGIGGAGGTAGIAGEVEVFNRTGAVITTHGNLSNGIAALSIGGSGGFGAAASSASTGTISIGGTIGGSGGAAGDGKKVTVTNEFGTRIVTRGHNSNGILAQSIGGGGGAGGSGMSTGDGSAQVDLKLSIGGFGASGGHGGDVIVNNAGEIQTSGRYGNAIMAQSIGGSGGAGGASGATTSDSKIAITFALGGFGGEGGYGGTVTVNNNAGGKIFTTGSNAYGIFAQSVGGGGGAAGAGTTKSKAEKVSVDLAVGGVGGNGNYGGVVNVTNRDEIETTGVFSHGIFAESIGGGGGASGAAASSSKSKIAIGARSALKAGDGSYGGSVTVENFANITTARNHSIGIFAHSVGGGGGFGGAATSSTEVSDVAVQLDIGGLGGSGGYGGEVKVTSAGSTIFTKGDHSHGIMAQSVGGGGGYGGSATSEIRVGADEGGSDQGVVDNPDKDQEKAISIAGDLGGSGGNGSHGGKVTVDNRSLIVTRGTGAIGIFAESVGGGGGASGAAGNKIAAGGKISIGAAASLDAGSGGYGGAVTVDNYGTIFTARDGGIGIFAHSVGGGGGSGGVVTSDLAGTDFAIGFGLGGRGNSGGYGGEVKVTSAATAIIGTAGDNAHGIFAQSVGGGGGMGGSATTKLEAEKQAEEEGSDAKGDGIAINATLGGLAADGNYGGRVTVDNQGTIITAGRMSHGIFAESVGGGGGASGAASNTSTANMTFGATASLVAGDGANGGEVIVKNSGEIHTQRNGSMGIFAHSVGGGGGFGGVASTASAAGDNNISFAMGGQAGNGGQGNHVDVDNAATGLITTRGHFAHGIFAQSVGGGGGVGGASSTTNSAIDLQVSATLGGFGGSGTIGGQVDVDNYGQIQTSGAFSHGIFAESIGGGGGASGAVTQALSAKTTIGGGSASFAGGGANGGVVNVNNFSLINTAGAGSHGIFAHSVGGGGGFGGASTVSQKPGDMSVSIGLGGIAGNGGGGGNVTVKNAVDGTILTAGNNAYGIFAQSVGGGGGAGGSSAIDADGTEGGGEAKGTAINTSLGGLAGDGNAGGIVIVENFGIIQTRGHLSHGIFAESIGGGGGASGSASNTSSADVNIGTAIATLGGGAADGGSVTVKNAGVIETFGNGALGIFAQSVGGGGGFGGSVSDTSAGESAFAFQLGGSGSGGGNGGDVLVDVSGDIFTHGERAHGVVAQSVGGAGGFGGDANGKTANSLAIGGLGGDGGDGGDVTVIRTGRIITTGKDSIAIIAQSVGGGGGIGGAGFGRFEAAGDGAPVNAVGFGAANGSKGSGGIVSIVQTGEIQTDGDRAHGIVAQAVGGSGGLGGTSSLAMGQSGAGSNGGIGDAAAASATANSQVVVRGSSSYAMFGQSATGQGNASQVTLVAKSNLIAQGSDSIAAYGESSASGAKGDIQIDLNGQLTVGGADSGVAVMLVKGNNNVVRNHSLTFATGAALSTGDELALRLTDFSALTFYGTTGNDRIENSRLDGTLGRIIGNIDLESGVNSLQNFEGASIVGLESIELGGGLYTNSGLMTNKGFGTLATVGVGGAMTQTATGSLALDISLDDQTIDSLDLTGAGDFDGTTTLNFLSIDKLFEDYVVASGASMTDSGIEAATLAPAVGFDFKFRVEDGTDLVLYADKPSFVSLIEDPASGIDDPNVTEMAAYFDAVEAASSPENPMARLINMLRFLPDEKVLGETLMRLTPHYAVHSFALMNRATDAALDAPQRCIEDGDTDPRHCFWMSLSPSIDYERDNGSRAANPKDDIDSTGLGGMAAVTDHLSIGASLFYSEMSSDITYKDALLSSTQGDSFQFFGMASYQNSGWEIDAVAGVGTADFEGDRDTTVAQVAFIPGETVAGDLLPVEFLEGIGNRVTYEQDGRQAMGSLWLAYRLRSDIFYILPALQLDARWFELSGKERGSLAAMQFDGSDNTYYAITPNIEIGIDAPIGDSATLHIYGRGGIRQAYGEWTMEGGFIAAESLKGVPPLELTEDIDSPVYMFRAGVELSASDTFSVTAQYDGSTSENTESHAVSVGMKLEF